MDNELSEISVHYFVFCAEIAFGIFVATRAVEFLHITKKNREDMHHMYSVSALCALMLTASLAPILFSDLKYNLIICYSILMSLSVSYMMYVIVQLMVGHVTFIYKNLSLFLIGVTFLIIISIPLSYYKFHSFIPYKIYVFWGIILLGVRFFLTVEAAISTKNKDGRL